MFFESPIKKKKVRNDLWAYQYQNGCIDIDGQKYFGFSMTQAIKLYVTRFPKYKRLN